MEKRGSEILEEQAEQARMVADLVFASPAITPMPDPIHSVTESFKNITVGPSPKHSNSKPVTPRASPRGFRIDLPDLQPPVAEGFKNITIGPSPKHAVGSNSKPVTPRASPRGNAGATSPRGSSDVRSGHILEFKNTLETYDELNDPTVEYPLSMCSLFIGDLARSVTEEQIREVFSRYGEVVKVDIKRDKVTHNNLGYGFLQYRTPAQACAGKDALNGVEIASRKVRIGWAQKNTTLFVGDLDGTVNTDLLRELFSEYGELVEDETFVKPGVGKFGFVRFKHRQDAEKAKIGMSRKVIGSRSIRIGWGDNNVQKHCVHVQFNPTNAERLSEERLQANFQAFGPVDSVSLPRHSNTGRLKGYCFIHFQDSEEGEKAAAKAISVMSSGVIDDVVVRSSYAKRHGFNKRNRAKSPSDPNTPPTSSSSMYNSREEPRGGFNPNGMMPMANPYFVMPGPGQFRFMPMQNQGYMNQFQKFPMPLGGPFPPYQTPGQPTYSVVPDYTRPPPQMIGRQAAPQSINPYNERSFEPAFESFSPHLGPAHVMSPQMFHASPVLSSSTTPLHMVPPIASYSSSNFYNVPPH